MLKICFLLTLLLAGVSIAFDLSWQIETVNDVFSNGEYSDIALDSNGYPHISYFSYFTPGFGYQNLMYSMWDGSSWQTVVIDSLGETGLTTSIAIDSNNYPHISYWENINDDLKYAVWNGSNWITETVDSAGDVGAYTSIALDGNDYPHISYCQFDSDSPSLKYASWSGSDWELENVDSSLESVLHTSLALDENGYPHIAYSGGPMYYQSLMYARWEGSAWQTELVDSDGYNQYFVSLALDSSGYPHISYRNQPYGSNDNCLNYAKWNGSSWLVEEVVRIASTQLGWYTAIGLDSSDYPHISHTNVTDDELCYTVWNGSTWELETIGSIGEAAYGGCSIAVDDSDRPHVSYAYFTSSYVLNYAHEAPEGIWGEAATQIQSGYTLHQPVPNPCEGTAMISFSLPDVCEVKLTLFNAAGRSVESLAEGAFQQGTHSVTVSGMQPGLYFYQIVSGEFSDSGKLIVVK